MAFFKSFTIFIDWLNHLPMHDLTESQKADALANLNQLIIQHDLLPKIPVITITGTNGKGSTAFALSSLLMASGYRVGCFTSPHLLNYCERISVDLKPISEQDFLNAANTLYEKIHLIEFNFFAILFLLALFCFKQHELDYLILEVGFGGRLDPTNAIDADAVILTQVALDHIHILGNTREQIGFEKSGLLRKNKIFICGESNPPESVKQKAAELQCQSFWLGEQFGYFMQKNCWDVWLPQQMLCSLPLPKIHPVSLSCAFMAIFALQQNFSTKQVYIKNILTFITEKQLAGRCQIIQHNGYECIVDVSHNPAAVANLAKFLKTLPSVKKTVAIFGAMADKDISNMLTIMSPFIDRWWFTDLPTKRAAKATDIAITYQDIADNKNNCHCVSSVQQAWQAIQNSYNKETRVIIFGSFVTAEGFLQEYIQHE